MPTICPTEIITGVFHDSGFKSYQTVAELQASAGGLADRGTANAAAESRLQKAQALRHASTAHEDAENGVNGRTPQLQHTLRGTTGDRLQEYGRGLVTRVRTARE